MTRNEPSSRRRPSDSSSSMKNASSSVGLKDPWTFGRTPVAWFAFATLPCWARNLLPRPELTRVVRNLARKHQEPKPGSSPKPSSDGHLVVQGGHRCLGHVDLEIPRMAKAVVDACVGELARSAPNVLIRAGTPGTRSRSSPFVLRPLRVLSVLSSR